MASKDNLEVDLEGESNLRQSQPSQSSGSVRVSVRKKGEYIGEDAVDTYLLNQIAKHIKYEELGVLARDLNIDKNVYVNIPTQKDQIWEVLNSWKDALPDDYKVNDFIAEIQDWDDDGYLDNEVWKRLKKCIDPTVLERLNNREGLETMSNLKLEPATTQETHTSRTESSSVETIHSRDSLLDEHILELSKRIPSGNELVDLGTTVLHLPDFKINAAMYDHNNSIQAATLELLSTWVKRQTNRKEAYTNLYSALRKAEMGELAGLLKKWVEGVEEETVDEIQKSLKEALYKNWKNCMSNEWLSPTLAQSEKLVECYVEPEMTWTPKKLRYPSTIHDFPEDTKQPLTQFEDIFRHIGTENKRILVEAPRGVAKTSTMASLGYTWIKNPESAIGKFDFVFLINLKPVSSASSLAELVRSQMGLSHTSHHHLQPILNGNTKHKVLLILDGYDKYIPGTNKSIDRVIEFGLPSGSVILTCCLGKYLTSHVRDQMDAVVELKGFNPIKTSRWIQLYNPREITAVEQNIFERFSDIVTLSTRLQIPIRTLMSTVIFTEKKACSTKFTQIVCDVQQLILTRETQKNFGCPPSELKELETWLNILGEMSWRSLQKEVRQHLLDKEEIEQRCPQALDLGLVKLVGNHVLFHCQPLQELNAAKHIVQRLETAVNIRVILNELFPTIFDAVLHGEVLAMVVGLMKDPRPVVEYIFELYKIMLTKGRRTNTIDADQTKRLQVQGKNVDDTLFYISLYIESSLELPGSWKHNQHWNMYNHHSRETPRDTTPIFVPSKMYIFYGIREELVCDVKHEEIEDAEIPECVVCMVGTDQTMTKHLMSICHRISRDQEVTDLWLQRIKCTQLTAADAPILSRNLQSLIFDGCVLPSNFMRSILHQLVGCERLKMLQFWNTDLREVEEVLIEVLKDIPSLGMTLDTAGASLSESFFGRLNEQLERRKLSLSWKSGLTNSMVEFRSKKSTERNEELSLEEINWLIQEQELNNRDSKVETLKGKETEGQPPDETLKKTKTEDEPPDEILKEKKTEDYPSEITES